MSNSALESLEIPAFALIVNTDSYVGNFERDLCGYATGVQTNGEMVSLEPDLLFELECSDDLAICGLVGFVHHQHGYDPVTLWHDRPQDCEDTRDICSLAIFFDELPNKQQGQLIIERVKKFCTDTENGFGGKIVFQGARFVRLEMSVIECELSE